MASITRNRGCAYYVPWITTISICFMMAGLGVWCAYSKTSYEQSRDALEALDVNAANMGRLEPALIASAVTYLVLALVLFVMALWRSSVEASHDATGITTNNAAAWLVMSVFLEAAWYGMVIWVILLGMADVVWSLLVYVTEGAIGSTLTTIAAEGEGIWLPSSGDPCPSQCLDLTMFAFISSELQSACICNQDQLEQAQGILLSTQDNMIGVLVGIWVMIAFGLVLLVDYGCQVAHTRRERELLDRIALKAF